MNIFVSGGNKNGKTMFAQTAAWNMAHGLEPESNKYRHDFHLRSASDANSVYADPVKNHSLYYIATMIPKDREDDVRIERHRDTRRGWGFDTLEQPVDLCLFLKRPGCMKGSITSPKATVNSVDHDGVFLLDSVTALLSNEMFPCEDGRFDFVPDAADKVADDLAKFAEMTGKTVFVSDFIYSAVYPASVETEIYMRGLAHCDQMLAKLCDRVYEVTYGFPIIRKQA